MKLLLYILLTITVCFSSFAQGENCDALVVNDSLFQQPSDAYNFDIVSNNIVHNILRDQIDDINKIISLEGNCLKFRISFACGCGTIKTQLVSHGKLQQDTAGRTFYEIKLLFTNFNKFSINYYCYK